MVIAVGDLLLRSSCLEQGYEALDVVFEHIDQGALCGNLSLFLITLEGDFIIFLIRVVLLGGALVLIMVELGEGGKDLGTSSPA